MRTNSIEDFILSNPKVTSEQRHKRVVDVNGFTRDFQRNLEDFASRNGYHFELIDCSGKKPNVEPVRHMKHLANDCADVANMIILVIDCDDKDVKLNAYRAAYDGATIVFAWD